MIKDYKIENIDIGEINSDKELMVNYRNLLKNKGLGKGNEMCFNYALKNKKLEYIDDSVEFIYEYYDMIPFKEVKRGDIVLFREGDNDFNNYYLHLGRVVKKRNTISDTIIRAKFGALGIYEHKLKYTPSIYGNRIEFWHNRGEL
jgi:hypothetical protein